MTMAIPGGTAIDWDETWTDRLEHLIAACQQLIAKIDLDMAMLQELAGQLDGQVNHVDEEAARVEAPVQTLAALDAASKVSATIVEHTYGIRDGIAAAMILGQLARDGMAPARDVQIKQQAIGAGPKLLATAGRS